MMSRNKTIIVSNEGENSSLGVKSIGLVIGSMIEDWVWEWLDGGWNSLVPDWSDLPCNDCSMYAVLGIESIDDNILNAHDDEWKPIKSLMDLIWYDRCSAFGWRCMLLVLIVGWIADAVSWWCMLASSREWWAVPSVRMIVYVWTHDRYAGFPGLVGLMALVYYAWSSISSSTPHHWLLQPMASRRRDAHGHSYSLTIQRPAYRRIISMDCNRFAVVLRSVELNPEICIVRTDLSFFENRIRK